MVAQIDEQHAAVVADTMAPAGETGLGAGIALAKGATGVRTVAMHGSIDLLETRGLAKLAENVTRGLGCQGEGGSGPGR